MSIPDIYTIFSQHITTLKETSLDDSNVFYSSSSELKAVSFDDVKVNYAGRRGLVDKNTPCSCDSLLLSKNNELYFIEFKNSPKTGRNIRQEELRRKVYDSLIIFTDETKEQVSEISKYTNLIVVYKAGDKDIKMKQSPSEGLDYLEKSIEELSNVNFIEFKLEFFKTYCFKNVYTFTQEEFARYVQSL